MNIIVAVVRAVAEREGRPATKLPPLYDAVDPDALRAFVESRTEAGATIRFRYCGYEVVVRDDGHVEVTPRVNPFRKR